MGSPDALAEGAVAALCGVLACAIHLQSAGSNHLGGFLSIPCLGIKGILFPLFPYLSGLVNLGSLIPASVSGFGLPRMSYSYSPQFFLCGP